MTVTAWADFDSYHDDEDLQAIREDFEDELRWLGGKGIVVEIKEEPS